MAEKTASKPAPAAEPRRRGGAGGTGGTGGAAGVPQAASDPVERVIARIWTWAKDHPALLLGLLVLGLLGGVALVIAAQGRPDASSEVITKADVGRAAVTKRLEEENQKPAGAAARRSPDQVSEETRRRTLAEIERLYLESKGAPGEPYIALWYGRELQEALAPGDAKANAERLRAAIAVLESPALMSERLKKDDPLRAQATRLAARAHESLEWLTQKESAGLTVLARDQKMKAAPDPVALAGQRPQVALLTTGGATLILEVDEAGYPRAAAWFLDLARTGGLDGKSFFDRYQVVARAAPSGAESQPMREAVASRFGEPFEAGDAVDVVGESQAKVTLETAPLSGPKEAVDRWPPRAKMAPSARFVVPDQPRPAPPKFEAGAVAVARSVMALGGREFIAFEKTTWQEHYFRNYLFFGRFIEGFTGPPSPGEKIVQAFVVLEPEKRREVEYVSDDAVQNAADPAERERLAGELARIRDFLILPVVEMTTNRGKIVLELFEDEAPNAVANFLRLAEHQDVDSDAPGSFYQGVMFHRADGERYKEVLKKYEGATDADIGKGAPKMVQFGDKSGSGKEGLPHSLAREFSWRRHGPEGGRLAMAASGDLSPSGSQAFITRGDCRHLDGAASSHIVFGRVIEGMEVVKKTELFDEIRELRVVKKRSHAYEVKREW
ncbi:MAG: peptidylprolyl isomerase [Planctomycetes bacterium]|nr:peptidylprolyl isomerase [Planctomycetota bacterium]